MRSRLILVRCRRTQADCGRPVGEADQAALLARLPAVASNCRPAADQLTTLWSRSDSPKARPWHGALALLAAKIPKASQTEKLASLAQLRLRQAGEYGSRKRQPNARQGALGALRACKSSPSSPQPRQASACPPKAGSDARWVRATAGLRQENQKAKLHRAIERPQLRLPAWPLAQLPMSWGGSDPTAGIELLRSSQVFASRRKRRLPTRGSRGRDARGA